jgi:hypothetical protein
LAGAYQVNDDCSRVAESQVDPTVLLEERFVVVDAGNGIRSITSVPPASIVTAEEARKHKERVWKR